ncbi:unnamed protein product [Durusdinium trenchii]|uniref:Sporulation protein RMD1 (Required for meiotic nuclear division protein 1) n=2 Tax=Durusdinium trenchii TaxID=1381693 RepID=A0ABP0S389_9DINO
MATIRPRPRAPGPLGTGRERINRQEPIVRRGRLNLARGTSLPTRSLSAPRGVTPVRFTAPGIQRGTSRRNLSVGPQRQRRGWNHAPQEPSEDWCFAYYLANGLNVKDLHQRWLQSLRKPDPNREECTVIRFNDDVMLLKVDEKDCFVFSFGCLVCWGCTPQEVNAARAYVENHLARPLESPKIEVDFLSIRGIAGDLPIAAKAVDRLAIAYSLAQSVRLSYWEQRIDLWVAATRTIPEDMAHTGRVLLSSHRVSQMMGELFALKNQVNLEFDTLDGTPDVFWDYEEIHLDVDRRIDIVNQRFEVLEDMFDVLQDKLNERQEHRLTWIIIWLCALEAVFTAFKVFWIAGVPFALQMEQRLESEIFGSNAPAVGSNTSQAMPSRPSMQEAPRRYLLLVPLLGSLDWAACQLQSLLKACV